MTAIDLSGQNLPGFDATTDYWQRIVTEAELTQSTQPPYARSYPARLPDGRYLVLPLRGMPAQPERCVASLIANQASMEVVDTLALHMAQAAKAYDFDVVVGLPTLGLAFAPLVAKALGHSRYVPLGYSRKYWYREALSEPVSSITTPGKGKLLYVDPNQLALLAGKRVLVVDDAVSSGTTMVSGLKLLQRCGAHISAIAVAMRQGTQWRQQLLRSDGSAIAVVGALDCPRMQRKDGAWWPEVAADA
ncbi:phosphoribosyltransferase [Comamonas sp. NoAH]|uniref:phosphoribosyltransferase n=1 Tax=Comamonas halotolerans TaxID=3041496 RepID=UPI0024E0C5CE|nr:phosphoribosyltransferase [Comamonas sp. NoAH]